MGRGAGSADEHLMRACRTYQAVPWLVGAAVAAAVVLPVVLR